MKNLYFVFLVVAANPALSTDLDSGKHDALLENHIEFSVEKSNGAMPMGSNNLDLIQEFFPSPEGVGPGYRTGQAIEIDQNQMIMGTLGFAVIFEYENDQWVEKSVLRPPYHLNELFGRFVSIQDDLAVVGAAEYIGNTWYDGVAYVYRKAGGVWDLEQVIYPETNPAPKNFGDAVLISDGEIFIADSNSDVQGSYSGAVYVFTYNNDHWEQSQVLAFDNGPNGDSYVSFGKSLAKTDTQLFVGASEDNNYSGSVFVYEKNLGNWEQVQHILPNDGQNGLYFGRELDVFGDDLVVAALDHNNNSNGKLYFYKNENGGWLENGSFQPATSGFEEFLGTALGLQNDVLIAGSYGNDDLTEDNGAVYVFEKNQNAWQFIEKIYSPTERGWFGYSVDADANKLVVSNGFTDTYTMEKNNGTWSAVDKIELNEGAMNQNFIGRYFDGISAIFTGYKTTELENGDELRTSILYVHEKGMSGDWELTHRNEFDPIDGHLGSAVIKTEDEIYFVDHNQLHVILKEPTGWELDSSSPLPFLKSVYGNNGLEERVVIKQLVVTDDGLASLSEDTINNELIYHTYKNIDNQWQHQELSRVSGSFGGIAFHDGLLYIRGVDPSNTNKRIVRAMKENQGQWQEQFQVISPDSEEFDNFGSAFAFSHNRMAVGAAHVIPGQNGNLESTGVVHYFKKTNEGWEFIDTIRPVVWHRVSYFGTSLHFDDEILLVGSLYSNNEEYLYEFEYIDDWQLKRSMESPYGRYDQFGREFVGYENEVLISAKYAPYHGDHSGRAALYKLNETYAVGVSISGLMPQNLIKLELNGREVAHLNNGSYTFDMQFPESHKYEVAVIGNAYPLTQFCTASNETGTIAQSNVGNITVVCEDFEDLIFSHDFEATP